MALNFLHCGHRRRPTNRYEADPDSVDFAADRKASFALRSSSPFTNSGAPPLRTRVESVSVPVAPNCHHVYAVTPVYLPRSSTPIHTRHVIGYEPPLLLPDHIHAIVDTAIQRKPHLHPLAANQAMSRQSSLENTRQTAAHRTLQQPVSPLYHEGG